MRVTTPWARGARPFAARDFVVLCHIGQVMQKGLHDVASKVDGARGRHIARIPVWLWGHPHHRIQTGGGHESPESEDVDHLVLNEIPRVREGRMDVPCGLPNVVVPRVP